jgi:hypothetical protein
MVPTGEDKARVDVEQISRLTKMHAKALTCFNFFNFHPVSTKFCIDIEHVILKPVFHFARTVP